MVRKTKRNNDSHVWHMHFFFISLPIYFVRNYLCAEVSNEITLYCVVDNCGHIIEIKRTKFDCIGLYRSSCTQGNSLLFTFDALSVVSAHVLFSFLSFNLNCNDCSSLIIKSNLNVS